MTHERVDTYNDWHAIDPLAVSERIGSRESGLSEAEAARRLSLFGPNQLPEERPPGNLELLIRQARSPLIYILLAAGIVTVALAEYVDAGVIFAALVINTIIGFVQERQAERSVYALQRLLTPAATVRRGGKSMVIDSQDLVVGDVVLLESGQRVPADLRLASTSTLLVDESLLTGESEPVMKQVDAIDASLQPHDRRNMAYTGTTIVRGRGWGYVVATGSATQVGAIATHVREAIVPESPLQRRVASLSRVIGIVVAVAAVTAFAFGIWAGEPVDEMFLVAVALAVSAVPEGLPVAFTITLALGVRRMAERQVIVRELPAVETLGSTTVIGTDKTGTLTQNQMSVQRVWSDGSMHEVPAGADRRPHLAVDLNSPLGLTLRAGVLASEVKPGDAMDDNNGLLGDPTEVALLGAAERFGVDIEELHQFSRVASRLPFEPERRYSAVSVELGTVNSPKLGTFVKGAPERILDFCTRIATSDGDLPLDPARVENAVESMAAEGLRVLAMAYRDEVEESGNLDEPRGLTFLGLQGMIDPPREGVADAVQGCRDAGIRVLMITGDHASTAEAIGSRIGLETGSRQVLTGADVELLDDDQLRRRLQSTTIFARVTPEHKLRVVRALRASGDVVAVTGDGVNDAPALRAADIGVAMGLKGTDVAREAADMVLTDDNFSSIYEAVRQGRITFDNLRKVTFFLLATNVAEILAVLVALAVGWPLPFRPAQILWLNLVTEGVQDVALAFEPGEPGVVDRPPRPVGEGIINRILWERTLVAGVVVTVGTLALFRWQLGASDSLAMAQTVALTTMVMFEAVQVFNARTSGSIFRSNPLANRFLFLATAAALGLHIAALYTPPMQSILRFEPLPLNSWLWIIGVSLTIVFFMELHKLLRRHAGHPGGERR